MVSASAWIAAFQALTVTGIKTAYDHPVLSVPSANLPAFIPLNFGVTATDPRNRLCAGKEKVRTADLMIAVEAIGQGKPDATYADYQTLSDALETALDAMTVVNFLSYELRTTTQNEISGLGYWGIVATVTGREFEA